MRRSVNSEITALAVPAIISNITTPLLGLADTAVTGHMGGEAFVGAIAVGGSMLSLAYWALNFLRMGTSGLTAQAYGAGAGETAVILWRSLVVAVCLSAGVLAISPWLGDALLYFMDADGLASQLARQYYDIVIFGAPAVLASYAIAGWLLGMQDSRGPMWMAVATNVVNILLSVVFVFVFGLGMAGVALGTLLAQWLGVAVGIAMVAKKASGSKRPAWGEIAKGRELKRFFKVNADIFLRTLCLACVTLWFTRAGAQGGTLILAANALLMQLFLLFSYFMDGFAFAGEALAGKYEGQSDSAGLRAVVKGIFRWGIWLAVVFTAVYALCGKLILRLLTDEPAIADTAMAYLPWSVAVPLAGVAAFVWDGVFIGLTLTRQMLVSMALAAAVFFSLCFLLSASMGNHGLWLAFISYLLVRGMVQTALYLRRR